MNSIAVTIPATIIPLAIAAFAAYGFAWMRFRGRMALFVLLVALLVVPLQIALVPVLPDYTGIGLNGTFLGVWLAHTGFGLPLAIYLVFGFVSQIPQGPHRIGHRRRRVALHDLPPHDRAALGPGARLVRDLPVPVGLERLPRGDDLPRRHPGRAGPDDQLVNLSGSRGRTGSSSRPAAFVSMIVPLIVFFALQRYFVRGLLAGSVKG